MPGQQPRRLDSPPGERRHGVRQVLLHSLAGRAIVGGLVVRIVVALIRPAFRTVPVVVNVADTVAGIVLAAGAAYFVVRLAVVAKRQLLWRVRRKLILSYLFIGFTPVILIASFLLLCGFLLFYNFSSYMVQNRLKAYSDEAAFLARAAVLEIDGRGARDAGEILARRQASAAGDREGLSLAVVPVARSCAGTAIGASTGVVAAASAGPWTHIEPPANVPAWIDCSGFSGVLAYSSRPAGSGAAADRTHLLIRAVAFPDGP